VVLVVIDQLLIRYPASVRNWRRKLDYTGTVCELFIDFKKAYDSGE
jgi:hypothetical protein